MNKATEFVRTATKVFEKHNSVFHLGKETPGVSFTHNEPRPIPAGDYTIIEPDSRDDNRVIIIDTKNYHMYAIAKKFIPSHKG